MRALSSSEMLQLWERGQSLHPLDQGLMALAAANASSSVDEGAGQYADLALGQRNRALAELRMACFGAQLGGAVACLECGEKLEFELDTRDLLANAADARDVVLVGGHSFRLPTSRDLALATRERDVAEATRLLVNRCRVDGDAGALTELQLEEIGEAMAVADPLAEPRLSFACALCGHVWDELLDVAGFFWTEVEVQVRRLLMEVHTLASAYGWSEAEILALSEQRRALYLQMVRA